MSTKPILNKQPSEKHKKQLFELYDAIFESGLGKKRIKLLTYLFAWEDCLGEQMESPMAL